MPTFESYEPGWPCWIDLMSPDVEASVRFYTSVFGWDAENQFDDDGNRVYTMFQLGGHDVAGLGGQPPGMGGMPAMWNTYICTEDAEATAAKVEAAGGSTMMPPMQVMAAGHMAIFADPTGAVFSVWQPGEHRGAGVANDANTWSWNELMSRDLPAAQRFYTEVFGWGYDSQEMADGSTYHVVRGGENGGLAGMMAMPAEMPEMVPNHWMVYFTVESVDATVEIATGSGGQVVNPAFDVPGVGRMATLHDAQGGSFSLMQPESA